jgi:hypothetical protein
MLLAVTKYFTRNWVVFSDRKIFSPSWKAGSQKCGHVGASSETVLETSPGLFLLVVVAGIPWLVAASLESWLLYMAILSLLCLCHPPVSQHPC